jgi:hypothetical protein
MTKLKANLADTYNAAILAVTVRRNLWGSILGVAVHALFVAIKGLKAANDDDQRRL